MFSKTEYWANREAGLRGQVDDSPRPKLVKVSDIKMVNFGGELLPMNRAMRRRRIVSRSFTKRGYNFGMKIGSKEYNLIHHIAKRQAEK